MASSSVDLATCSKLAQYCREGWGTAYEYYVKYNLIERFLTQKPKNILLYGLPEKYGLSLDHIYSAKLYDAEITIVDERNNVLDQLSRVLESDEASDLFRGLNYQIINTLDLAKPSVYESFDVGFNTEVLQRLDEPKRQQYTKTLAHLSKTIFSFAPNSKNSMHNKVSGLDSLTLSQMKNLSKNTDLNILGSGYLDMPPFPPGLRKPGGSEKRGGLLDSVFPPSLKLWTYFERACPNVIKSRASHIVYTACAN